CVGTSFGRGGATTFLQDLQISDCIVIEGSNMAEAHPVGFQWVMEAKARGATIVHIDPRFSRTSAMADLFVPMRAGADIAFLGGLINYVLTQEKYFREYVLNYTNASVILSEDFTDTEDLDGVFSGLDREKNAYDPYAWRYEGFEPQAASGARGMEEDEDTRVQEAARGEAHGAGGGPTTHTPETDETLEHPRCVFQVLKRHFARYTPEMVARIAGVPEDAFRRVCELVTENSGRDKTTASAGPSTRWASSTSARRRSSRRCSATSAGRAAGSSRCAGTRPSRGPPT